jgi:hypothetical protein
MQHAPQGGNVKGPQNVMWPEMGQLLSRYPSTTAPQFPLSVSMFNPEQAAVRMEVEHDYENVETVIGHHSFDFGIVRSGDCTRANIPNELHVESQLLHGSIDVSFPG